ncbi:predicted protein [Naegleria gruberi]|uniref:Predicted protein n=1 Tax=Naegleria gruberi TaxID=5762 RepID=D2VA50_NAEGR|nr:uncharacterized protein NAEGRDRAFT_65739 [Naegleria gruberi]EFC46367.1 predicted protein [Naegleria gruberi]|eukprot:XP_002679111.1 predicted protein [Naegleria gruberi strain NEG-M]
MDLGSDDSSSMSSVDSINDFQPSTTPQQRTLDLPNPIIEVTPITPTNQKGLNSVNSTPVNNFTTPMSVTPNIGVTSVLQNLTMPITSTKLDIKTSQSINNEEPFNLSNNMDTTEYVLLLFFQEFKEQASKIIDEFAYENVC